MPVYEVVMQHPSGIHRVRYRERLPADIGDALTIDGTSFFSFARASSSSWVGW